MKDSFLPPHSETRELRHESDRGAFQSSRHPAREIMNRVEIIKEHQRKQVRMTQRKIENWIKQKRGQHLLRINLICRAKRPVIQLNVVAVRPAVLRQTVRLLNVAAEPRGVCIALF